MPERMWFFARNNQQEGPVSESQLKELLQNKTLPTDTLVWSDNLANWTPASQLDIFVIRGTINSATHLNHKLQPNAEPIQQAPLGSTGYQFSAPGDQSPLTSTSSLSQAEHGLNQSASTGDPAQQINWNSTPQPRSDVLHSSTDNLPKPTQETKPVSSDAQPMRSSRSLRESFNKQQPGAPIANTVQSQLTEREPSPQTQAVTRVTNQASSGFTEAPSVNHPQEALVSFGTQHLTNEAYPWRRFWARSFDQNFATLLGLLCGCPIILPAVISGHPLFAFIAVPFVAAGYLVYEPFLLMKMGTTFGKKIWNINVTNADGSFLSFGQACQRTFLVWLRGGYAANLVPSIGGILMLVIQFIQYTRLNENRTTSWDIEMNLNYNYGSISERMPLIIGTFVAIGFFGILVTALVFASFFTGMQKLQGISSM